MHGQGQVTSTPPLSSLPPQVDGLCDTLPTDTSDCKQISEGEGDRGTEFMVNNIDTHVLSDIDHIDVNTCNAPNETNGIKENNSASEDISDESECTSESSEGSNGIICKGCGDCITGANWYKCTECCTTNDHFDICERCYNSLFHKEPS